MSFLETLATNTTIFHPDIPLKPAGRYVHFILLRETESFPLFQTDGSLNVIRVRAGLHDANKDPITRLILFKRKQSSPERLTGRELLRSTGVIHDDKAAKDDRFCEYNSANFCKQCPDCIHYGYAIGSEGAEKSKVYVDTAYSITPYELSHKAFAFNALFEHGTMTDQATGKTRSSFGEQDYVVPQVFFPSIVTLRDPTYAGFLYIFGNLLRTERYGAQETRTGRVYNHLVGVVFSNGEIFSNLRFTQAIYDLLREQVVVSAQQSPDDLLERGAVLAAASQSYETLIAQEPITRDQSFMGTQARELQQEVVSLYSNADQTRALVQALDERTRAYVAKAKATK
ncbi:type I-D CRISPR-associated protein Cas7/Csc2 [Candidatus Viridilinea mediisalina]|uniref:Type I-D CRISPR-associated protein Cas7/Csc2 n=1 Tax=Candidatus Viridilinea mediisalina TaxID=2024553 RepID=A0A2A6REH7_9CHLR|nr:type I-D CRISPR-associated protein Cas7/Csc2 [Candidatus Viridilinea mediisalina]PDW01380.1 type I-D CRISPR-associated protein Cas7/Csc2 [Candidatus Viridilinea mediisalina]